MVTTTSVSRCLIKLPRARTFLEVRHQLLRGALSPILARGRQVNLHAHEPLFSEHGRERCHPSPSRDVRFDMLRDVDTHPRADSLSQADADTKARGVGTCRGAVRGGSRNMNFELPADVD